jgi:cell division protein FtsI (penicillin-binding protein 3)
MVVWLALGLLSLACLTRMGVLAIKYRTLFTGKSSRCLDMTNENWKQNPLFKDTTCNCFLKQEPMMPRRGDIYDDLGNVLVGNTTRYEIALDGKAFRKENKDKTDTLFYYIQHPDLLNKTIREMAAAFYRQFHSRFPAYDQNYYEKKLNAGFREGKYVTILTSPIADPRRWIGEEDVDLLEQLPLFSIPLKTTTTLDGIKIREPDRLRNGFNPVGEEVRVTPYGELAKRSLRHSTSNADYGLERVWGQTLGGVQGSRKIVKISGVNIPLGKDVPPQEGSNLHTTLNLDMQNIVHNELLKVLRAHHARWGCAALMETRTGKLKAITNLTFDNYKGDYFETINYFSDTRLEPGSTFKLASLLAFLERTPNDSSKRYPVHAHTFEIKDKRGKVTRFPESDGHGQTEDLVFPIDVFQQSSNVGIASMIFDKYSKAADFMNGYPDFVKKLDSMYIFTRFVSDLGPVKKPKFNRQAVSFKDYFNFCFGTGVIEIAPIQTLAYFNAVANDGKMLVPYMVEYTSNARERTPARGAEVLCEQIAKPSTIARAKKYLEAVVTGARGTARQYQNNKFTFAGKTGTRDIWVEGAGYDKSRNCISFCGYFPADTPRYTCIVYIYDVQQPSSLAAGVFAHIAREILNLTDYNALKKVVSTGKVQIPHAGVLPVNTIREIYTTMHIPFNYNALPLPYAESIHDKNSNQLVPKDIFDSPTGIPDTRGMIPADAIQVLANKGYKVLLQGKGKVSKQLNPTPKKTITIILE